MEDPLFVCEVGQSQLSALETKSGGRRSVKERQQSLIKTWCHLLEVSHWKTTFVGEGDAIRAAVKETIVRQIAKNIA